MATIPTRTSFDFTPEGLAAKDRTTRQFEFINWRTDRWAFFLRDEQGKPLVATANLPRLSDEWKFPEPPFPECPIVAVRPYRFIPPPFGPTKDHDPQMTARRLREGSSGPVQVPDRWELVYGLFLYAEPSDESALKRLLKERNELRRKEYKRRLKEETSWTREEVRQWLKGKRKASADDGRPLSECGWPAGRLPPPVVGRTAGL